MGHDGGKDDGKRRQGGTPCIAIPGRAATDYRAAAGYAVGLHCALYPDGCRIVSTLGDWLANQPFTLTLSSGFFGFFCHAGVLAALDEAGLKPARITGASAGALAGSACAAGLSPRAVITELTALTRKDFWDPGFGAGLLKGALFRDRLTRVLPVQRIEQCTIPLAVSVHQWAGRRTRVIERGEMVPAVYASCAVPLLFHPIRLDGKLASDGGIADRWGLAGVSDGERVFYHHLGSRSPWRRKDDPALRVPARANLAALELFNIPRSGPNRLRLGPHIVQQAWHATRAALHEPAGTVEERFRTQVSPALQITP